MVVSRKIRSSRACSEAGGSWRGSEDFFQAKLSILACRAGRVDLAGKCGAGGQDVAGDGVST